LSFVLPVSRLPNFFGFDPDHSIFRRGPDKVSLFPFPRPRRFSTFLNFAFESSDAFFTIRSPYWLTGELHLTFLPVGNICESQKQKK
jgi:hypothetical protein